MKKKISIKGYVNNPNYSTATFLFQYKGTDFTINYGCNTPEEISKMLLGVGKESIGVDILDVLKI